MRNVHLTFLLRNPKNKIFSAGDWLQGPHVYALYESYGMTKVRKTALMVCLTLVPKDLIAFQHQIEILFIAGFGSSVCFGTFVGSVADK